MQRRATHTQAEHLLRFFFVANLCDVSLIFARLKMFNGAQESFQSVPTSVFHVFPGEEWKAVMRVQF